MPAPTPAQRKELTEKQIAFVIWAAQPDGVRKPDTQEEFALALGIHPTTAWRWAKDPRVLDAVRFVTLQQAGDPKRVGQILDMLFNRALRDDQYSMKAAELWLKSVGVSNQFVRGNSILEALDEDDEFSDFSTEELERIASEARAAGAEDVKVARAVQVLESRGVATDAS